MIQLRHLPKVGVESNQPSSKLAAVHSGDGASVVPLGDFSKLLGRGTPAATPVEPPMLVTAYVGHDAGSAPTRATEAARALWASVINGQLRDEAPVGMGPVDG